MEKNCDIENENESFLTIPFIIVTLLSCFMTICLQMTVSAMPIFVVNLGVAKSLAGIATTACTLSSLIFRPVAARMTDSIGGKKTAIFGSIIYILVFGAYFICGNIFVMLILRVFQGIGMSIITTALGTIATAMVPSSQITKGMGYFSLGNAVALSIGPALGLYLVGKYSFNSMFLFGLITSVLVMVLLIIVKYENRTRVIKSDDKTKPKSGFIKNAVKCGAIVPSFALALLILCQTSLSTYLYFFTKDIGINGASEFFTLSVFGMVVSKFIIGKLCERWGNLKIAIASGVLLFSSFVIIAMAGLTSTAGLLVAGILYGFGYGIFYTFLNVEAVRKSTAENRGVANSLFFGAKDVGTSIGALGWGMVIGFGYPEMYMTAAVLIILSIIIYINLIRRDGKDD